MLPTLVALGLVDRREVPPSALFSLVQGHVAARAVRSLSRARDAVFDELGALASKVDPNPVSVVVFGSVARGDADAASDLDVMVVRPTGLGEDDKAWGPSIEAWRISARRLTGNPVRVIQVEESEVVRRFRRPSSLFADVLRDGVTVYGSPLVELGGARPVLARPFPVRSRSAQAFGLDIGVRRP